MQVPTPHKHGSVKVVNLKLLLVLAVLDDNGKSGPSTVTQPHSQFDGRRQLKTGLQLEVSDTGSSARLHNRLEFAIAQIRADSGVAGNHVPDLEIFKVLGFLQKLFELVVYSVLVKPTRQVPEGDFGPVAVFGNKIGHGHDGQLVDLRKTVDAGLIPLALGVVRGLVEDLVDSEPSEGDHFAAALDFERLSVQ